MRKLAITIVSIITSANSVMAHAEEDVPSDTIAGAGHHLQIPADGLVYASCGYNPNCIDHLRDSTFARYETASGQPYPIIELAPQRTRQTQRGEHGTYTTFLGWMLCETECGVDSTLRPGKFHSPIQTAR